MLNYVFHVKLISIDYVYLFKSFLTSNVLVSLGRIFKGQKRQIKKRHTLSILLVDLLSLLWMVGLNLLFACNLLIFLNMNGKLVFLNKRIWLVVYCLMACILATCTMTIHVQILMNISALPFSSLFLFLVFLPKLLYLGKGSCTFYFLCMALA